MERFAGARVEVGDGGNRERGTQKEIDPTDGKDTPFTGLENMVAMAAGSVPAPSERFDPAVSEVGANPIDGDVG